MESDGATGTEFLPYLHPILNVEVKPYLTQEKIILQVYSFAILFAINLFDVLYS